MISIVLGSFMGDEGKGQTVHNICAKNPEKSLVIRFSGGHQVGHTVKYGDLMHTFSNFGSGTLLGVPTYWSEYCTVDPVTSTLEAMDLKKLGITPKIIYNPLCQVIVPFDVYSQVSDVVNLRHGTVGTGFKTCLDRVKSGYNLMVIDCLNIHILREKVNAIADNYYHMNSVYPSIDLDNWCRTVNAYFNTVQVSTLEAIWEDYDNLIFEGSQGILLDQRFGIMPHCTPSNTTSQNAHQILKQIGCNDTVTVNYVTRPYITRHGNGPFPSDKPVRPVVDPNNQFNDFQKSFRAIEFDPVLFRHSLNIDSMFSHDVRKKVIVTHWDEATDKDMFIRPNFELYIYEEYVRES